MITAFCNYSIIALEQLQGVQKNVFNTILRVMLWAKFMATIGLSILYRTDWAYLGYFGPHWATFAQKRWCSNIELKILATCFLDTL